MFIEDTQGMQLSLFDSEENRAASHTRGVIPGTADVDTAPADKTSPVIAVIDDDERIRLSAIWLLKTSGYQALPFASGEAFLSARLSQPIDAVILDMNMPGMTGLDVLLALETREDSPAVVVLTAIGDIGVAVEAMKLRAADFIQKPCTPGVLLGALRRALDLRERARSGAPDERARALVDSLSPRQREVLAGMVAGRANKMIAWELGLSVRTVEDHRAQLIDRLGVGSSAEAIRIGLDGGLAPRGGSGRRAEGDLVAA